MKRVRPAVSPGWRAYGPTWTLRTVLMISLLLFSLLPAATVGWFLYTSNLQSVQTLSESIIENVVQRVKTDTENHLMQVHEVLNGLIQQRPTEAAAARARLLIEKPGLFEQSASAMSSMMPDVPKMYLGTYEGDFLAVETLAQEGASLLWVSERKPGLQEGRLFSASYPGDRRVPLPLEPGDYEPRSEVWYRTAIMNKGRAFTPVQVFGNQLQLTLAQPVYAADGAALGVFAVDLPLKHLGQMLQGMRISPHGAVFLLDEKGLLLASSTGDALFSEAGHRQQRHTPEKSRSAMIRSAYADVAPSLGKTRESSVQRESFLHRIPTAQGTLMVALKPFGETWGVHWSLVVVAPESDFTQELQAALQKTLAATGLTLALGALLAIGVAYQLSRSFQLLSAAAAQLARGKVPSVQHKARITEVHQLSLALHDSAAELRRNQAAIKAHALALRQTNESLEIRVAQRTAELNASREEALSSVRAKAAFLAAMSHEIRTPLNGVVGMATLLADTCLDREQRDYVSTMRISSDQLLGVINDILDFSKIESGRLELEHEALNLHTAIQEVCDMNAPRAREKGLELLLDMGEELPGWVCGDVIRLRQVLLNLVNNAVKFTEQGQVMVSAHVREGFTPQQGALLEFRVRDSGIGIPVDRQATLFESFVQVDAGTTRKYGGSGLGLAICKRLAGLMGGSIGLKSMPGQGSTFWFTARLGYAAPPEAAVCALPPPASLAGTPAAAATAAEKSGPSAPKNQLILVVDDNAINLKVALAMLARLGYETATAVNGREAVERVAASLRIGAGLTPRPYAAVLMDLDMPVMDGCTACCEILASHGAAAPPVIALTASVLEADRRRCFAVGMVEFLSKPLRMAALSGALARHARHPEPPRAVALTDSEFAGLPLPSGPASRQRIQVLVDWSRLEQFREFDDDDLSMTREVIALFASESPLRINDIRMALSACDSAALSRAAHALKGAASNVGAQALSESCGLLEQSCLDGQWPVDAAAQVGRIVGFSDKTCQALSDWEKPAPVLGIPAATV